MFTTNKFVQTHFSDLNMTPSAKENHNFANIGKKIKKFGLSTRNPKINTNNKNRTKFKDGLRAKAGSRNVSTHVIKSNAIHS